MGIVFTSVKKMEEENIIKTHWLEQKERFIENLAISRKRPTKRSVHELRVAVKKLRSYLRLNKQLTGDKWRGSFSKVTALFKSFSRQSDLDVAIQLTKQLGRKEHLSLPWFKDYLSVNRSLVRKWIKQDALKFNEHENPVLDQQFDLSFTTGEISEKIIQLSSLKIKKAKNLSKHFKNNAHKIRKQLKDVYNWVRICPEDLAENLIHIKALDQLLKHLGSWQDHFVLRKKIEIYVKAVSKNEEREVLQALDKSLANAQDDILEKAIKKWKEIEAKN